MADDVIHLEERRQFSTRDGAAYLDYRLSVPGAEGGGQSPVMDIYHTYVPSSKRGGGIAGKLCRAAFEHAKRQGFLVQPSCSYVSDTFLPRNPDYDTLVAPHSGL